MFIFVFFTHRKYSCSFIILRWKHWCQMDYFNDVFTTFLGLEPVSCIAVYGGSESSRISSKYLNLCSVDELRSYGFGTTRGWVINDSIFIFGWTNPLKPFFKLYCPVLMCTFKHTCSTCSTALSSCIFPPVPGDAVRPKIWGRFPSFLTFFST